MLLVALLAVGLLFQGKRGIFETTEDRYSSVASEMIRLDDWIVPHLNEEAPHFTKPPLTYWLLAASTRVFGRNELALRLPGAIAFVLTVLLVARAGYWLIPEHPLLPAVIYGSFLFPATVSNVVSTDNLVTFAEVAAMVSFIGYYFGTRDNRLLPAIAGWAFFGLAFLTKGYPALLPVVALAAFHWRGRHRPGDTVSVIPCALAFAGIGASWYVVVIWRDPSLLHYFIADELYGRITGEHNRNPEWYKAVTIYGPVFLLGTLPWTLHSARAVRDSFRRIRQNRHGDRAVTTDSRDAAIFLLLWLMIPTAVFVLAKSRLELYLLPQFAPLATLTALSLSGRNSGQRSLRLTAGVGVALVLALRFVASGMYSHNDSRRVAEQILALPGDAPSEVVFVEVAPYRGIAFYLGCEVEEVTLTKQSAGRLGSETLREEWRNEEPGRIWLVPLPLVDEFKSVVKASGVREITALGGVDTDQPHVALALRK